MTDNPWKKIYDAIGEAAALEMLAEEAAELSAAASKLARIVRGENPARLGIYDATENLAEELTDVHNAAEVVCAGYAGATDLAEYVADRSPEKMRRWYYSLGLEEL